MVLIHVILSVFFIICGHAKNAEIQSLQNVVVDRKIDIATHLVKITTDITFINNGNTGVRSYLYSVLTSSNNYLAFIGATIKDDPSTHLVVTPVTLAEREDSAVYSINLPAAAAAGKTVKLVVETVFTHYLRPFPVQILQSEKQNVVYEDGLYFYTPYATDKQTITVETTSSTIESYTKTKPTSIKDNVITYGPYPNIAPFTTGSMRVHYENNSPFLTVTDIERVLEVSHWGNIAVEEHIDVTHSGAQLKGPFSRYHYQRMNDGVSSVKSYKTFLPSSARDVYYRDEIGNISTSNMREMDDFVEIELRPRFPLFGGWKTHYLIGYNVPSYEYIYNRGNDYAVKMRFVDHIIDDQVIDNAVVKVILPEGSSNIEVKTPYKVTREQDSVHHTYLDTSGRPVIIMSKKMLVEQHISDFEVHYKFQKWMLLQEPILVVAAFYLLCIVVIIYVRLDFSITKDEAKETRMRVAKFMDEVRSAQDKRSALHQSYDDAAKKFKTNKDGGSFKASVKKIDTEYRILTTQIDDIAAKLRLQGSESADKVAELQRLEHQYKEQIALAIQYADKVVSGKMNRSMYDENDNATVSKRAEISEKIDALMESM